MHFPGQSRHIQHKNTYLPLKKIIAHFLFIFFFFYIHVCLFFPYCCCYVAVFLFSFHPSTYYLAYYTSFILSVKSYVSLSISIIIFTNSSFTLQDPDLHIRLSYAVILFVIPIIHTPHEIVCYSEYISVIITSNTSYISGSEHACKTRVCCLSCKNSNTAQVSIFRELNEIIATIRYA